VGKNILQKRGICSCKKHSIGKMENNPFHEPLPVKRLKGYLGGAYSRKINHQTYYDVASL
jgi:Txe/YoeB family toxin of Txe-Axe toxin-antitoxin module